MVLHSTGICTYFQGAEASGVLTCTRDGLLELTGAHRSPLSKASGPRIMQLIALTPWHPRLGDTLLAGSSTKSVHNLGASPSPRRGQVHNFKFCPFVLLSTTGERALKTWLAHTPTTARQRPRHGPSTRLAFLLDRPAVP